MSVSARARLHDLRASDGFGALPVWPAECGAPAEGGGLCLDATSYWRSVSLPAGSTQLTEPTSPANIEMGDARELRKV